MPSSKAARRFADIVENIEAVFDYVDGYGYERFEADRRTVDACERCLQRVSEAARKLGDYAEEMAPEIPWRDIRDYGNFSRHEYDRVSTQDTWSIIREDLPRLRESSRIALKRLEARNEPNEPD